MKTSSNQQPGELRDLYRSDYVNRFEENRKSQSKRVEGIMKRIPFSGDDVVCDFACGNGLAADHIHHAVQDLYCVDFSEEFIDVIRRKVESRPDFKNVHPYAEDIVSFCEKHSSFFDKALTLDFSEHIYDDDFKKIYSAIRESLKPGGTLYLHTPNGEFLVEILKDKGIMEQFPEHIAVRKPAEYVRLLEELGYKEIEVKFIPHYNILKYLHLLSFVPFFGKYFKARIFIQCKRQ